MPALVEQWLSRLGQALPGASRPPLSWFDLHAPQQSATPQPASPPESVRPLNVAWVNGQPVPLDEEPAGPSTQTTPQAAPAAPGPTIPPSPEAQVEPWRAPLSGLLGPASIGAWRGEGSRYDAPLRKAESIASLDYAWEQAKQTGQPMQWLPLAGEDASFEARVRSVPDLFAELGFDTVNPDVPGPTQAASAALKGASKLAVHTGDVKWATQFTDRALGAGWSQEVVDHALETVGGMVRLFKKHPQLLPLEGGFNAKGERLKSVVDNADFGFTIDIDRTCKRVAKYWETVHAVEAKMRRTLVPNELLRLGQMMRKAGDIAGCTFCYVEASRRQKAYFQQIFTQWPMETITREMKKTSRARTFYGPERERLLTETGWTLKDLQAMATFPGRAAKVQLEGTAKEQELLALMNKFVAGSTATAPTGLAGYHGELFAEGLEKELGLAKKRAGARWWSATDFDPSQAVETLKAMTDLSVLGMPAHGYTKDVWAPIIFGKTGMKLNTSLAVHWNGKKFIEDINNGMPLETALRLRRESPDVGTMLVAKNKRDLEWALSHPDVDMIIPHHAANWKGGVETYGAFDLDDFAEVQHEHWIDEAKAPRYPPGTRKDGKDISGKVMSPGDVHGEKLWFKHWMEALGYDKVAAGSKEERRVVDAYLGYCRTHNLTPKFSHGTYVDHVTKQSQVFPGYTDHPGYAKLLKDYARTDTPQRAVDVSKVDVPALDRYVTRYVRRGGWQATATPDPTTVSEMTTRLRKGGEVTPQELLEAEQALRKRPVTFKDIDRLRGVTPSGAKGAPSPGTKAGTRPSSRKPWRSPLGEVGAARVTESPAFASWFSGSVVADAGQPKVVYHGTTQDFETFKHTPRSIGFHFGSPEAANEVFVSKSNGIRAIQAPVAGRQIKPVYLSLKHPLRVPDLDNFDIEEIGRELQRQGLVPSGTAWAKTVRDEGTADALKEFDRIAPHAKTKGQLMDAGVSGDRQLDIQNAAQYERARQALERLGFDGFVYPNEFEGGGESYVVFRASQIQPAFGSMRKAQ